MHDSTSPDDRATTTSPTASTSAGASPALSVGPFDERPAGELRRHLGDTTPGGIVVPDRHAQRAAWLRAALHTAGVEAWGHDVATIEHVAAWEPEMVHVIGSWVLRAAAGPGVR